MSDKLDAFKGSVERLRKVVDGEGEIPEPKVYEGEPPAKGWDRVRSITKGLRAAVAPAAIAIALKAVSLGWSFLGTPEGAAWLKGQLGDTPETLLVGAIVTGVARYYDDKNKHNKG